MAARSKKTPARSPGRSPRSSTKKMEDGLVKLRLENARLDARAGQQEFVITNLQKSLEQAQRANAAVGEQLSTLRSERDRMANILADQQADAGKAIGKYEGAKAAYESILDRLHRMAEGKQGTV